MNIIMPSFEILEQGSGLKGMYEAAEYAGRICFRSQENAKNTETSAQEFCERQLMAHKHTAPLEHGTVYLKTDDKEIKNDLYVKYKANPYSKARFELIKNKKVLFVTTNLRVLYENGWMDDLQYQCDVTKHHERRVMVQFTLDRFTGEEFLRHRKDSFCRESTRYVNYLKDKFDGGNISFILPPWLEYAGYDSVMTEERFDEICRYIGRRNSKLGMLINKLSTFIHGRVYDFTERELWEWTLMVTEKSYNVFVKGGWQPQQARTVLPCAIKSPLLMTGFVSDWIPFFNMRSDIAETGKPHPQAEQLATPLRDLFLERGYIKEEDLFHRDDECE